MKDKALTLVEMVMSLVIIAIISAIVLVSFSLLDRRRLEAAARNLVTDLSWVREMAVARNQNYTVTFDQTNNTYAITDAGGNPLDSARPIQRLWPIDITQAPNTLIFQAHQGTIVLNPLAANVIRLERSGRRREITVYRQTGYVKCSATIIP